MEAILQKIWELTTIYGIKILAAIVIFIVSRWIARGFKNLTQKVMEKRNVDKTLMIIFRPFKVGDYIVNCSTS